VTLHQCRAVGSLSGLVIVVTIAGLCIVIIGIVIARIGKLWRLHARISGLLFPGIRILLAPFGVWIDACACIHRGLASSSVIPLSDGAITAGSHSCIEV
jgi:hypothetical protein